MALPYLETPHVTRAQLYALVWEKPMVHVARPSGAGSIDS